MQDTDPYVLTRVLNAVGDPVRAAEHRAQGCRGAEDAGLPRCAAAAVQAAAGSIRRGLQPFPQPEGHGRLQRGSDAGSRAGGRSPDQAARRTATPPRTRKPLHVEPSDRADARRPDRCAAARHRRRPGPHQGPAGHPAGCGAHGARRQGQHRAVPVRCSTTRCSCAWSRKARSATCACSTKRWCRKDRSSRARKVICWLPGAGPVPRHRCRIRAQCVRRAAHPRSA